MAARPRARHLNAIVATSPLIATAIGVFFLGILYSVALSFTGSRLFPSFDAFVGLDNYRRLWATSRWTLSAWNILIYGVLVIGLNLAFGFLMAAMMDRRVRGEDGFRTVFLYPFALSLVVTGVAWQWMLDPALGLRATALRFGLDLPLLSPLTDRRTAIFGVVVAGVWHGSGVTMAIMLAGLRGIDAEIWKAARVEGVPTWRFYLSIALPMLKGTLMTAFVLQAVNVVRVYDLVVALTGGGPGIATEVPAKFVIDHITNRVNVSLGMAAAAMMLLPVILVVALSGAADWRKRRLLRIAAPGTSAT